MDLPLPPERDALVAASEIPSPGRLLESGFLCVRQGRYGEGLTFFALACERLSPDQTDIAAVLDAFMQSHKAYSRAQEELLQASRQFSRADAEQQAQLVLLENLLSTLLEETNTVSPNVNGPLQNARSKGLLHILRSSPEVFNSNQLPTLLPQRIAGGSGGNQPLPLSSSEESPALPALYITCFGRFEVKRLGSPVVLCSNRHGQTILRYLAAQSEHCATGETLMTLLWPEDEPEVAHPRLHTAICALRRSLNHGYTCEPGGGYIVCKNRTYYLGATILVQSDVDQFLHYYQIGRQTSDERVALYEKACHLYTGPFLPEDKYADWSFLQREHLSRVYIDMCKTLTDCQRLRNVGSPNVVVKRW
ncbi:MAG TPA: hypothetical protein VEL31_18650 [Ktedonobacteraceae bacterium]|nr:hypothetical protein [Ktedonobacteraceae bacterium]